MTGRQRRALFHQGNHIHRQRCLQGYILKAQPLSLRKLISCGAIWVRISCFRFISFNSLFCYKTKPPYKNKAEELKNCTNTVRLIRHAQSMLISPTPPREEFIVSVMFSRHHSRQLASSNLEPKTIYFFLASDFYF